SQLHNLRRAFSEQGYTWQESTVDYMGQDSSSSHGFEERRGQSRQASATMGEQGENPFNGEFPFQQEEGVMVQGQQPGQYMRINYLV
ncbi:MAG: hypothetical protein UMV23_05000, partial [Halanaerobium sp.]|nr:hypothetical protein [Halanaerobium sp.]